MKWIALSLLLCSPGWCAITLVPGAHLLATNPSSFDGYTSSALNTTGVTLLTVAVVFDSSDSSAFTFGDNKGNTYTTLTSQNAGAQRLRIYYVVNPVVGSGHTWTIGGTVVLGALSVNGLTGNSSSPFDTQSGFPNTGPVSSIQPGTITPTQSNEIILLACSAATSSNALSIDSGFTILDQVNYNGSPQHYGLTYAYKINGAGTAGSGVNPTCTIGGGDTTGLVAVTAAFIPAPSSSFGQINNPVSSF